MKMMIIGAMVVFVLHFVGFTVTAQGLNLTNDGMSIVSDSYYEPALAVYLNDGCNPDKNPKPGSVGILGSVCTNIDFGGNNPAGVVGIAAGDFGHEPFEAYGVYGEATSSGLRSGYGVYGIGRSAGVYGTGSSIGVEGTSTGSSGAGGRFINTDESGSTDQSQVGVYIETYWGNLIEGYETLENTPYREKRFYVTRSGEVYADGAFHSYGADLAESVILERNDSRCLPGHVLEISADASQGSHTFTISSTAYSTRVAGIYSTQPGFLGQRWPADDPRLHEEIPMAVVGIVPCRVSAENGSIRRGDLLVSANEPGHAMKGTDRLKMIGAVIGKALGQIDSGTGMVDVLVTLQ